MKPAGAALQTLRPFLDGVFTDPARDEWLQVQEPACGRPWARIPRGSEEDVRRAAAGARRAFEEGWGRTAPGERADLLDQAAAALEARSEEFARCESRDTGKPLRLARELDIPRAVANLRFFAGALRHDETPCHESAGVLNYTSRRPLGPVALITPWNLPLYLLTWKLAPALAMGNTVVAKPSEWTPGTATLLAGLLAEILPPGVFQMVHGLGETAGRALVRDPDIRAVSFTGGTATGAEVARSAAPAFKKLSLELGGKNPTLVFADADLEEAAAGAVRAAFTNQGQICLCGSRILVEASVLKPFREALVERVRALRLGDPADPATDLGALISAEHRDRVESYLALARDEGGRFLTGGGRPPMPEPLAGGYWLEPALVEGLPAASRCATEEIFGPVASLHPFRDEAEALRLANGVRYGLCASVWTRDLDRAHRLGHDLEAGMVWVNTWLLRDLRTPFGGVKDSGLGREGGRWSLEFFSEARNLCIRYCAGDVPAAQPSRPT